MSPEYPNNGRGQLASVRLHDVDFRISDSYDVVEPLNYVILTSSEVEIAEDLESGRILFNAVVGWRSQDDDESGEPVGAPFDLDVTLEGAFTLSAANPERDELSAWIEFNSEHLLWPYLRSTIANLTTAAGLPPLTIYTIGVPTFDEPFFEASEQSVATRPRDIASG